MTSFVALDALDDQELEDILKGLVGQSASALSLAQ